MTSRKNVDFPRRGDAQMHLVTGNAENHDLHVFTDDDASVSFFLVSTSMADSFDSEWSVRYLIMGN